MEKKLKYDFSGWATRNDLVCSDGRTIQRYSLCPTKAP